MSVQSVSPINQVNFRENQTNNNDTNTVQNQSEIKNGKTKLVLALTALGIAAVAGVAIYKGKQKAGNKVIQETEEVIKKEANSIQELIKKDNLPFNSKTTISTSGENLIAKKTTFNKCSAEYKGKDVVVEYKNIVSRNSHGIGENFAVIRDAKTNELIEIKPVTAKGNDRPLAQISIGDNVKLRKTETIFDKSTKTSAKKTVVNGKTKAITTTVKNPDGSKTITVNYGKNGNGQDFDAKSAYKKIINITADGKKSIKTVGTDVFEL